MYERLITTLMTDVLLYFAIRYSNNAAKDTSYSLIK